MADLQANSKTRISSLSVIGTATQVFTGNGTLERIVVGTSTTWTIGLIDGTSGSTVNIQNIKSPIAGSIDFGVTIANGLRIITTGSALINPDITVVWRQ